MHKNHCVPKTDFNQFAFDVNMRFELDYISYCCYEIKREIFRAFLSVLLHNSIVHELHKFRWSGINQYVDDKHKKDNISREQFDRK